MASRRAHLAVRRHDQRCPWNALRMLYFCIGCWTVGLITVLLTGLWSTRFIFSWWSFILRNLLEAVCKCSLFCIVKVCFLQVRVKIYIKISLGFKEQSFFICSYQETVNICEAISIFISKIQLIPSWKSYPNPLHVFAKLQIGLEPSKMKIFRWAWLLNFRWNRSAKRGYGFLLSGANWLKANLGIVMLSLIGWAAARILRLD